MKPSYYLNLPINSSQSEGLILSDNKPRLLSIPVAVLISLLSGIAVFVGSSRNPSIIPDPVIATVITIFCVFLLLIPFMFIRRSKDELLSPEFMGALGYFIYIGIGIVTNYRWPEYAVNPSLFEYLPYGVILQSIGALAFFGGTYWARRLGKGIRPQKTVLYRLAFILILYASFALYVSFLAPRVDALVLLEQTRSGESVSWINSVGLYIVFQSSPMLVAAWVYLRNTKFRIISYLVIGIYIMTTILYLVSGSRTYATQLLLLYVVSYFLAAQKASKKIILIAVCTSIIVLGFSTSLRLLDEFVVSINPATMDVQDVGFRVQSSYLAMGDKNQLMLILENIRLNFVYHLSDNQAMAYLVRNSDADYLYGKAIIRSLLSGLPRQLRPSDYYSATNTIMNHYRMFKERAIAAPVFPDWQMSIGLMGYADFGFIGLILYPFILGIIIRYIYTYVVVRGGLGQAGWLLYAPMVFLLWNPLLLGPDSIQITRLLLILGLLIFWSVERS